MIIGLDGRVLQDKYYSGVSEYALQLFSGLFELDQKNEYRLFYNSSKDLSLVVPKFHHNNVKEYFFHYPNKLLNYGLLKILSWPKFDKLLGNCDLFFLPHFNFASFSTRTKLVVTIHDLSFLRHPDFFSWRKNFWHRLIGVKRLCQRADLLVAVSEHTKNDLIEFYGIQPEKIKVIYSGISSAYQKIESAEKLAIIKNKYSLSDRFILHLGTVEPRKNIEGLIYAFEILKSREVHKDLKLVLAGGLGWKTRSILAAREKSIYKDDIIFLGYVDNKDKPEIYNLATIFAYPSFYEGFGFPPLEAMACGTPVISSNVSSLPEIIGQAGVMVDPYNFQELAITMDQVLLDDKMKNSLITAGYAQASKYTWAKTASSYLEIFK